MSVSCAAILCVRNEQMHIARALNAFIAQGIEVAVIDHQSTDGTLEICEKLCGCGVLSIDHLEWRGVYDQTAQLEAKAKIIERLRQDWIIHADADEWLQSPKPGESLLQGLDRVSGLGFNVVNFEEFVFLPYLGQEVDEKSYTREIISYYFFAPFEKRLMRAWKRSANLRNIESGGHTVHGRTINLAPDPFVMRHYIVLSHEQAVQKYVGRKFSQDDLEKNWHGNRLHIGADDLILPERDKLIRLPHWESVSFDRTEPKKEHYWQW